MLPGQEVVCNGRHGGRRPLESSATGFDRQHRQGELIPRHSGPRHNSSCHINSHFSSPVGERDTAVMSWVYGGGQPVAGTPRLTGRHHGGAPGVSRLTPRRHGCLDCDRLADTPPADHNKVDDMPSHGHGITARGVYHHDSRANAMDRTSVERGRRLVQKSWLLQAMTFSTRSLLAPASLTLWICLLLVRVPSGGQAAPGHPGDPDYREPIDGTKYMQKFGYLPQSDLETGALRTEEEMRKAIRKFQAYAHIDITGNMDKQTLDKMASPRCGVADNVGSTGRYTRGANPPPGAHLTKNRAKRYVIGPSKWEKRAITFRILNYTPDLDMSDIRDSIIRAFQLWQEVTHLTFHEVMQGHADIYIQFARGYHADGYPFDGEGLILAHAFFPGEDRGGDMHFDEDETWTIRSYDGTNLYVVAAHELGHALGLAHSSVMGALMYPWYQGYTPNLQLTTDDIAGIQYLYGYKYTPIDPPASTDPPRPGPTRPAPTYPPVTPFPTIPYKSSPPGATTLPTIPPRSDHPPDPCTTAIDAISVVRGEIYAFKGRWFWRIDEQGVMRDYPVEISRFWYNLPDDLEGIDALYEREPGDGRIIFFKNDRYWIFKENNLQAGFPQEGQSITELGFPSGVKKVDAAFVWGHNQRTYFITGDMYWKYDEFHGQMEYDYPRDMTMWGGVPLPVNGAFTDNQGVTYFLKGLEYWEFNDAKMHVRKDYPQLTGPQWLECEKPMPADGVSDSGSAATYWTPLCIYLIMLSQVVQKLLHTGHS